MASGRYCRQILWIEQMLKVLMLWMILKWRPLLLLFLLLLLLLLLLWCLMQL